MRSNTPKSDVLDGARSWAKEIFSTRENLPFVVVEYEPPIQKGRRNKKAIVQAREEILTACKRGDTALALKAMSNIRHFADPGIAVCVNVDELTEVLCERVRFKQYCYFDNDWPGGGMHLVLMRE